MVLSLPSLRKILWAVCAIVSELPFLNNTVELAELARCKTG